MISAPEAIYFAAATASVRKEGVNDGYIEDTVREAPFRAAVDVAYNLGREQVAALLREHANELEHTLDTSQSTAALRVAAIVAAYRNAARMVDGDGLAAAVTRSTNITINVGSGKDAS